MKGNLNLSNGSYSSLDMQEQESIRYSSNPHHHHLLHPTIYENFPLDNQNPDNRLIRTKSTSDEEDPSFDSKGTTISNGGKKEKPSPWHRVKWTDDMVRLLITAVSYIGEESTAAAGEGGPRRRKFAAFALQKKGKWKSVSKAMAERGHLVSPQQCEDKFNDLNKRYKRLNEILGRGTSCEVVENPAILDSMGHVSDKSKDEVRKILSSKHLHYEEMCSYHNGNRLHLPPDVELQRSLRLALGGSRDRPEGPDRDGPESDESEEDIAVGVNPKRVKASHGYEGVELERRKLKIQAEILELEKEKFKWRRFCEKKDRELDAMRMEVEAMRLENERMALEIKEMEFGL